MKKGRGWLWVACALCALLMAGTTYFLRSSAQVQKPQPTQIFPQASPALAVKVKGQTPQAPTPAVTSVSAPKSIDKTEEMSSQDSQEKSPPVKMPKVVDASTVPRTPLPASFDPVQPSPPRVPQVNVVKPTEPSFNAPQKAKPKETRIEEQSTLAEQPPQPAPKGQSTIVVVPLPSRK